MKILSIVLSVLLCAVLAAAGIACGVRNGWLTEREQALSLTGDLAAMAALIDEHAMDAANLTVVAGRHLPAEDEQLVQLSTAAATLAQAKADVQTLVDMDVTIRRIATAFAQELPKLPSVQESARAQVYVAMLTGSLTEGASAAELFAASADAFNTALDTSFTGWLAKLLGVEHITTD